LKALENFRILCFAHFDWALQNISLFSEKLLRFQHSQVPCGFQHWKSWPTFNYSQQLTYFENIEYL